MNILGAFSFSKIIKTFLPGLVLAGSVVVFLDLLFPIERQVFPPPPLWRAILSDLHVVRYVMTDGLRAGMLGAMLIPCALFAGFTVNTALWRWCNRGCRNKVRERLSPTHLELETALQKRAQEIVRIETKVEMPLDRIEVATVLRPISDLDKTLMLHESYFAWFEFQLNTMAAGILALAVYLYAVLTHMSGLSVLQFAGYVAVPLIAGLFVARFFYTSALQNLQRYEEKILQFHAATLYFHGLQSAPKNPARAGSAGRVAQPPPAL